MLTGKHNTRNRLWKAGILSLAFAILGVTAFAQGYDPRRRSNGSWGNDGYTDRDRNRDWDDDDDRWDDRDGRSNRNGRWNGNSRGFGSRAIPLDPRFRVREGDYRGRNGGRFEFRGRIDDEVIFFIRGGRVSVQNQAGRGLLIERWSLDDPLPVGHPVRIDVDREDGRGRVQLLEAPSPRNNYTAVVRVYDPSGGADRYHFEVKWRY